MNIKRKLTEAKWVNYPEDAEVKFKIRSFPTSMGMFLNGTDNDLIDFTWKKFNYCVVDWQGINDEDSKPLECNEENKKFIFDYVQELMLWVSTQVFDSTSGIVEKKTKT